MTHSYNALLLLSFGGPEAPEEVMPFLRRVVQGRNVPDERLKLVAEHYYARGGKSPINEQNRALIEALKPELEEAGLHLPIYFGNRNWHPFLQQTLQTMADDGIRRAQCFVTSAFSSYSGCRQYREDIQGAQEAVGTKAPQVDKLRVFFNHPDFIGAVVARAKEELPVKELHQTHIIFTAHSIPQAMARGCDYEQQLQEASRLVAEQLAPLSWQLAFQSRSGPPQVPWLGPDIGDALGTLSKREAGGVRVLVVPLGFVSDHMEVLHDLDEEAREAAEALDLTFHRAPTPGTHPLFVRMIRRLIEERQHTGRPRAAVGTLPPRPHTCAPECCVRSRV